MRRLLAAVAVAFFAAPVGPARAQGDAGVIAYTRDPDGPAGPGEPTIYVARPDGTGERALATGYAPSLALGDPSIAYSLRSGGALQLLVGRLDEPDAPRQVTSFPDREGEFGPGRYGVVGSEWSPSRTRLALRLMEGSTTTLAFVNPDGSAFVRLEFGHLFGSGIAWRNDDQVAVGTDTGLHLVDVSGKVTDPPGRKQGDTAVVWLDGERLVVNGTDGADVLDVGTGERTRLLAGATAWDLTPLDSVFYTRGTEVGMVTPGEPTPRVVDELPAGAQVRRVVCDGPQPILEYADAQGALSIHLALGAVEGTALPPFAAPRRVRELRHVADGGDVTLSNAAAYDDIVFTSAGPADPVTRSPAASPAVAAPGPVDPPAGRSAFADAVPAASDVSTDPATLLVNLLLTMLLVLLITFPAELFNSTLEEHYDEVRGWFRLGPSRPPRERRRGQRVAMFVAYAAVAALLYGLLDPGFGIDAASARLYAGLLVGMVVVTFVFSAAPLAYVRRRYRERGLLRVLPGTLGVAVACVVVSRLAQFEPGYLYGIVGGFAFSRAFSEEEEGRNALIGAGGVIVVSLLAWLLWQPVDTAAARGEPGLLLGLTDSTLATVAVGGLQGLVIGLLPIRSLQGYALSRWNRAVWAGVFGTVLFAFVHLLLHPSRGFGDGAPPAPFFTWLALFLGFGAVSVSFWGYFRMRRAPSSG